MINNIRAIQQEVGVKADGVFGSVSRTATQNYLASLCPNNPWPTQSQRTAFYGNPGQVPLQSIDLPWRMFLYGNNREPITTVSIHPKCAASFLRVLRDLGRLYPNEQQRIDAGITAFYGIYNPRRVRGGSSWSNHAWACAIDLDANKNGLHTPWPQTATMPWEVIKTFAREGWRCLGTVMWRDAMHFEAIK